MNFDYWAEQVEQLAGADIDINVLLELYSRKLSPEQAADYLYEKQDA